MVGFFWVLCGLFGFPVYCVVVCTLCVYKLLLLAHNWRV